MLLLLAVSFVLVPLVEIAVIIRVSQAIGGAWTVAILVLDSLLGAWLLRREGARAWNELRRALVEGRWPGDEVAHGAMVIVGGTLLVTPGFVTDVVGFGLLLRPVRHVALGLLRRRSGLTGGAPRSQRTGRAGGPRRRKSGGSVLDVEVVEIRRDDTHGDDTHDDQEGGGSPPGRGALP